MKYAENGQGVIVRVYNVEENGVDVDMRLCRQPDQVQEVNLLEEPMGDVVNAKSVFSASIAAKKIVTYRVMRESSPSL